MNLTFDELSYLVTNGARPFSLMNLENGESYECCANIEIPDSVSLGFTFLKPEKQTFKLSGIIGYNWYGGSYFDSAEVQDGDILLKTIRSKEGEGGVYQLSFESPLTEEKARELLKNFEAPTVFVCELPMIRSTPAGQEKKKNTWLYKIKKHFKMGLKK